MKTIDELKAMRAQAKNSHVVTYLEAEISHLEALAEACADKIHLAIERGEKIVGDELKGAWDFLRQHLV